jgi:hypothetical protein
MSDTSLIIFKTISNFTNSLGEMFGEKQRSLKLYGRLINKTTLSHDKAIIKHVDAFRKFCKENRIAIIEKDMTKIVNPKISYSDRVFINIKIILNIADTDTSNVIWSHLLTISALVDPAGKAKDVLQSGKNSENSSETNFLSDIIGKVEQNVDPNTNPLESMSSLFQSGVFTEMISGMTTGLQDGSMDLGKLMGTVTKMAESLEGESGDHEGSEGAMNVINKMMSQMMPKGTEGSEGGTPDITGMLGPLLGSLGGSGGGEGGIPDIMSMMTAGASGGGGNSINDTINAQFKAAKDCGELADDLD